MPNIGAKTAAELLGFKVGQVNISYYNIFGETLFAYHVVWGHLGILKDVEGFPWYF